MKKILIFLSIFLSSVVAQACCGMEEFTILYQRATFIGKIRIIGISQDPLRPDYQDITYELLEHYKGSPTTRLKAALLQNTCMAMRPEVNTVWMVFARAHDGIISFSSCEGYRQSPGQLYDPQKIAILNYLKNKKITDPNPLYFFATSNALEKIRGFQNRNQFAVFKVTVGIDRSVHRIRPVRKFENKKLQAAVETALKADLRFNRTHSPMPRPVEVILFCSYFKGSASNESSVSTYLF